AETSEKQSAIQREQALKRALTLLKQIEQAEVNWTAAKNGKSKGEYSNLSTYASDLRKYISQLESGKITTEEFNTQINRLGISFQGTGSVIRASGEAAKSFGERVKTLGEKFSTWFSVSRVIMSAYSNLKKMVSASIELDNAMNQLQIVTKESDQTMGSFGTTAAESAKRIGSSITDFVSSATTYARLGYSLNESSQLAEFTAMLQNVGDIDVSEAQDAITSIVKAFNIGTDQIESVMDKMVVAGNNFPISVSQIAEGMTNASSALAAAGNSFDQSVALLTAANTTINLCRVT
ncbi:MAG: phage tail tape measure protein, partial [Clostridia bacterium]|nr:phage tail tape measure protein [Clostridia bacterium]